MLDTGDTLESTVNSASALMQFLFNPLVDTDIKRRVIEITMQFHLW